MPVEVTQEDREAAAKLMEECQPDEADFLVPFYLEGGTSPLAEAFAAHRTAAEQRGYDRAIAEVVAWLRRDNPAVQKLWCDEWQDVSEFLADAIEAGEHRGGEATAP